MRFRITAADAEVLIQRLERTVLVNCPCEVLAVRGELDDGAIVVLDAHDHNVCGCRVRIVVRSGLMFYFLDELDCVTRKIGCSIRATEIVILVVILG